MENNYSDIDLARYFSGQCTDTEKESIESWSEFSPENKELFNSARFVWERSLEAENVPYKTEDALGKVHARLGMNNNKQLKNKTLTIYSKIAAIAAVIMLPLLFFYLLSKNNQQTEIAYKTVNTENEIRNI
ncbi:MAG: hypothetical protein HC905_09215 [Bacteroidales bacterium]|nr:hypothetical protein [Bacteroidales bacterium]